MSKTIKTIAAFVASAVCISSPVYAKPFELVRDMKLIGLQSKAKKAHLGLWADSTAIPPWEWREQCWGQGQCQRTK